MVTLIAVLIVGAIAYRIMTPEERTRTGYKLLGAVGTLIRTTRRVAAYRRKELEPFNEALRTRTSFALVTPALVVVNVAIFGYALVTSGVPRDPASLVGWGASVGPRTTNGEWWRLVTAMFVHGGLLALLVNMAALVQVGLLLERLVGAFALATTYVAAGVSADLVSLRMHPMEVTAGDTGAVLGLYGLLFTSLVFGWLRRSDIKIPLVALKWLTPVTLMFVLYNFTFTGGWSAAQSTALAAGLLFGIGVVRDVGDRRPPWHRTGIALAATVAMAVVMALFVRGISDVRPEIERLVALEQRTADAYRGAVEQLRKGRTNAAALADLIDRTIVPELQTADAHISALQGVPPSDEWLIAGAHEYLRLRSESWSLRAEGLREAGAPAPDIATALEESGPQPRALAEARHRSTTKKLGTAEATAHRSLKALERIQRPRDPQA